MKFDEHTLEYRAGHDAGLNGPNTINCHFRLFSTPEKTKEWERGNKAGAAERIQREAKDG